MTSLIQEYKNKYLREWRHKKGISKKYYDGTYPSSRQKYKNKKNNLWKKTPKGRINVKLWNAFHRGKTNNLSIKIIQMVYEDNIKLYGTLTCYLCLKPILFGKDHLEHKIPLSRDGTNLRENLDIACQVCNLRKNNKTEEEYRKLGGVK